MRKNITCLLYTSFTDYKTQLQEIVQKNRQETLEYRLAGESGPDHAKVFTMELLLNSNVFAQGTGRSKNCLLYTSYQYFPQGCQELSEQIAGL